MEEKLKQMLKLCVLGFHTQTDFHENLKDEASHLLGYESYEELSNEFFEKEQKTYPDLDMMLEEMKK